MYTQIKKITPKKENSPIKQKQTKKKQKNKRGYVKTPNKHCKTTIFK